MIPRDISLCYDCFMTIIDLSVLVNQQTPVYPGDPKVKISPAGQLSKDGFVDHIISMGTHAGTHIDAPMHMIENGKSLNQLDMSKFIGRGVYVDCSNGIELDGLLKANIKPGDIVLLNTGMSDHFFESVYYDNYLVMSEEVANYLIEREIKMVGLDTGSADNVEGFPIHKLLLGNDILIIENLTNLAELAGKDFTVYALPIKLGLDGAPARVIAQVN